MIYRKINVFLPKFQSRLYAILNNAVPLRSKPKVPRKSWEQWKPTNGNFDLPDPLRDMNDWSFTNLTSPTPLSKKLYGKKLLQLDLAKQIVNNLKEIKETEKLFAEELVERKKREETAAVLRPKAKGTLRL
uniref:Large ribosomal subunit protein mL52 n=1 Tax=Romanomermis culicivorax TaxID=13658 RepID=A0A915JPN0_ROMCU